MTWGIPGPVFLVAYAVALAVLVVKGARARRAVRGGPPVPGTGAALGVDAVAYLSGGESLLATSAVVGLHESGSITTGPATITATPNRPRPGSEVQRRLHEQLYLDGPAGFVETRHRIGGDPGVAALREGLQRRGLLPAPVAVAAVRRVQLGFGLLGAVGVLRLLAGLGNDRPVGILVLLLLTTLPAVLVVGRLPRLTDAGSAALQEIRGHSELLRSGGLPGDRALAVAVFGAGVLWLADAELAGLLGLGRATALASGDAMASGCGSFGDGGGSGGSDGGGSSCGGSSCGSSCGGGGCGGCGG